MKYAWIIVIAGLWIYPILGYFFIAMTKTTPAARRIVFLITSIVTGLTFFGLLTNISTTVDELDWLLVSAIYLSVSTSLWWVLFRKNKIVKVLGVLAMVLVFGIGYLSGTIGALGVGFVVAEFENDHRIDLGNGLIYKEFGLGNAISDYRGKRVEIFKTLPWLPVLEWRIKKMEYYDVIPYMRRLYVVYKPNENKIYLWTAVKRGKDEKLEHWSATLDLK